MSLIVACFKTPASFVYRQTRILCQKIYDLIYGTLREPYVDAWDCVCRIQRIGSTFPDRMFVELYTDMPFHKDVSVLSSLFDRIRLGERYIEMMKQQIPHGTEYVHIAKLPGDVFVIRANHSAMPATIEALAGITMPTVNPFLLVEYLHPEMSMPIVIPIPNAMVVPGNELLSAAFVLRWLKYNIGKDRFVFDSRYLIRIMDNNINDITLEYGQHVRITPDGGLDVVRA